MSAPFAKLVADTAPIDPLAKLEAESIADAMRFGVLHANIAFALKHLDGHPMALAALDSSLAMIRERCPSLDRSPRMGDG